VARGNSVSHKKAKSSRKRVFFKERKGGGGAFWSGVQEMREKGTKMLK